MHRNSTLIFKYRTNWLTQGKTHLQEGCECSAQDVQRDLIVMCVVSVIFTRTLFGFVSWMGGLVCSFSLVVFSTGTLRVLTNLLSIGSLWETHCQFQQHCYWIIKTTSERDSRLVVVSSCLIWCSLLVQ